MMKEKLYCGIGKTLLYYLNNLRYEDDTTLMAESKEDLKNLLMNVKEERERAGLKLNIQKMKIMASGPISVVQFSHSVVSDSLQPHGPSPCYSLKLCIQMGISFLFSFAFLFSSFHSYL